MCHGWLHNKHPVDLPLFLIQILIVQSTIHATPDGAAERASTVAQLTGYKPLPDGAQPPASHPSILPAPLPDAETDEEDEALQPAAAVAAEERRYAVPRVTAELQPMLRCWVVQAWPPQASRSAAPLSILDATASVVWSEEEEEGEGEPRPVELRVRFRVEDEGSDGEWFYAALPFASTAAGVEMTGTAPAARDERGERRALRLPVTAEVRGWSENVVLMTLTRTRPQHIHVYTGRPRGRPRAPGGCE